MRRASLAPSQAVHAPRLLIVDDNPADRAVIKSYLRQANRPFELLECESAERALELCRAQAVEVLLVDYLLPGKNGLELLQSLSRGQASQPPKVIMTTGSGNERIAVEAMRAGAHDYLPKDTLSAPVLLRALQNALKLRRAEAVLRESEGRFTSLADAAPGFIWLADARAEAEFLNKGWLEFTGSTLADALGEGWLAGVHPDDRQEFLARYRAACQERAPFSCEFRLRHQDGSYRWLSCEARARLDPSGALQGFTGSCSDVSRLRQAQLESEETYRLLFASMLSGVLRLAEDGRIVDANPAALKILGVSREQILGASIYEQQWRPTDLSGAPLAARDLPARRVLEAGWSEAAYVTGLTREDGRKLWLYANTVPFQPGGGAAQGAIVSFVDVTDLREATDALEQSERRYRAIFNAQLSAILSTDASGKVTSVNAAAEALFGYRQDELLGRNLWTVLDGSVSFTELLRQVNAEAALSPQASAHFEELTFQRKSGERFPAEVAVTVLRDQIADVRLGYTYVLRDISLQRQAESKLAETNRRLLQGRDDERRRLARDLHDGTVQDLVALSYELANLERELDRAGESLPHEELLVRLGRWRAGVGDTVRQLRGVISNLRPAGLEDFGLEVVLESYLSSLRRSASEAPQGAALPELKLEVADEVKDLSLPVALCLFRSAQEAVTNTLKHADAKCVIIRLSRAEREVNLSVEDDGKGFEAPSELNELAQLQHFGLIGLAERADLMGGTFMVNTQPGRGTAVFVSLPLDGAAHAGA